MTKEEIKNLGSMLKQRRKEMNLSLKEAENATSIRMTYLQSIEEGDLSKLISPVYAQGFVKQYAGFLGMDGDRVVREHPDLCARSELQEFDYGIGTLEVRGHPGSRVKWFPNALWIMAIVAVIILAWLFAKYLNVL